MTAEDEEFMLDNFVTFFIAGEFQVSFQDRDLLEIKKYHGL